jgi:SET domain-containing protein
MMRVPITVRASGIHGLGLFTVRPIAAGTTLWRFTSPEDYRVDVYTASDEQLHYGYINPRRPHDLVICGGKARYWNFPRAGEPANSIEGLVDSSGEAVIVAARDIAAGEELLIDPASDADAARKLKPAHAA